MIRVFGSNKCTDCNLAMSYLDDLFLEYEYVDALLEDPEIEKLCDDHNIDDLPHIQILNKKGIVVDEFFGIKDFFDNFRKITNT